MRAWYRQWYGQDVPVWKPGAGWGWQGGQPTSGAGPARRLQWPPSSW
jgi:hypothetical protein